MKKTSPIMGSFSPLFSFKFLTEDYQRRYPNNTSLSDLIGEIKEVSVIATRDLFCECDSMYLFKDQVKKHLPEEKEKYLQYLQEQKADSKIIELVQSANNLILLFEVHREDEGKETVQLFANEYDHYRLLANLLELSQSMYLPSRIFSLHSPRYFVWWDRKENCFFVREKDISKQISCSFGIINISRPDLLLVYQIELDTFDDYLAGYVEKTAQGWNLSLYTCGWKQKDYAWEIMELPTWFNIIPK